jgi:hypothetical protein
MMMMMEGREAAVAAVVMDLQPLLCYLWFTCEAEYYTNASIAKQPNQGLTTYIANF